MLSVLGNGLSELSNFLLEFCVGSCWAWGRPIVDTCFKIDDMFLSFFQLLFQLSFSHSVNSDLFSKVRGLSLDLPEGADLGFVDGDLSLQAFDFLAVGQ